MWSQAYNISDHHGKLKSTAQIDVVGYYFTPLAKNPWNETSDCLIDPLCSTPDSCENSNRMLKSRKLAILLVYFKTYQDLPLARVQVALFYMGKRIQGYKVFQGIFAPIRVIFSLIFVIVSCFNDSITIATNLIFLKQHFKRSLCPKCRMEYERNKIWYLIRV